jgi:UDP-glucose 4-epimerase
VFGDGRQTRDYVFAVDVARANLAAATAALPPARQVDVRAFNVGTGRETSVLELAQTLQSAAGTAVPIQHLPARPGELPRSSVSNQKAVASLEWRPQVNLEDGLRMTYEYFSSSARAAVP